MKPTPRTEMGRTEPSSKPPARELSPGIFRDHYCWKCNDGAKPCAKGHPHLCDYPRAKND